jgi:hypothetical protein
MRIGWPVSPSYNLASPPGERVGACWGEAWGGFCYLCERSEATHHINDAQASEWPQRTADELSTVVDSSEK